MASSTTYIAMIPDTVSHFKGRYGLHLACDYLDGYLDPHYHMPAIRLEVDMCKTWDNTVVIFDQDNGIIVQGWC